MPIFDRLRGPFRGPIEFATHGVKNSQPGGGSADLMGTDTQVVRDGKIVAQSFAGKIMPKR